MLPAYNKLVYTKLSYKWKVSQLRKIGWLRQTNCLPDDHYMPDNILSTWVRRGEDKDEYSLFKEFTVITL